MSTLAVFGALRGETSEPADPGAVVTPGAQDAAAIPGAHMMTTERTRDEILSDLAETCRAATRLVYVDPAHEAAHERLNELLEELERAE